MAPVLCGLFFFGALQLVFLGIVGEYVGSIHSRIFQNKWLVVEKERINFDAEPAENDELLSRAPERLSHRR